MKKAVYYYEHFFKKNGKVLPMDEISIEGHKAIGQILALQNQFKESIKHFEYISAKLNT